MYELLTDDQLTAIAAFLADKPLHMAGLIQRLLDEHKELLEAHTARDNLKVRVGFNNLSSYKLVHTAESGGQEPGGAPTVIVTVRNQPPGEFH